MLCILYFTRVIAYFDFFPQNTFNIWSLADIFDFGFAVVSRICGEFTTK